MDLEKLLKKSTEKDPTWVNAKEIVHRRLLLPDNVNTLIRNSWSAFFSKDELIRNIGFSAINCSCLLNAAEIPTYGDMPARENIEKAIETLGIRYCSVIIGINAAVRLILKSKPPVGWRELLEDMMTDIEIGYRLGVKAGEIGLECGILLGFARHIGLGVLLSHDIVAYRKYVEQQKKFGKVGRKILVELFNCEPYQVGALAIQRLGFGTEAAFGTAIGLGDLNPKHIDLGRDIIKWKAGFAWLDALRSGRNYPPDVELRNFFPAIAPPTERSKKNPVLEVLYTEVAKVRSKGSLWTWHLPRPDYERTQIAFQL